MMIYIKDASESCRKGSSPKMSEGNTFCQQANIDQIEMKTCQKLQRKECANRAWFLIPRDACDVIWLNLFRLLY